MLTHQAAPAVALAQVVEYVRAMEPIAVLLRANAAYLVAASAAAFLLDAAGFRVAGVGFVHAHELALIVGLLLWSASPRPCWHLAAAAVQALFGAANVAHWETFVSGDMLAAGYLTTAMHMGFAGLQCLAAKAAASAGALTAAVEPA